MKSSRALVLIAFLSNIPVAAKAQKNCSDGFQSVDGVCISQRMTEYIVCVKNSGGNAAKISEVVKSVSKTGGGIDVNAKAPSIGGGLGINASQEKEVVKLLEKENFPGATQICADIIQKKEITGANSPPNLLPEISGDRPYRTLYFKNNGGEIFNPMIDTVAHVFVTTSGTNASQINLATTGSATYGMRLDDSKKPFSIQLDMSHQALDTLASSIAKKKGVDRQSVWATENIVIKITFQDTNGSNFERYFEIRSNDSSWCDQDCISKSNNDRYQQVASLLSWQKKENKLTSINIDDIIYRLNH